MDRAVGGRVLWVGFGLKRLLNVRDEGRNKRKKKVRNADKSGHPCILFNVQMTLFTSSQQKYGLASNPVHHADSSS